MTEYSKLYAIVFWQNGDRIQTRIIRTKELEQWLDRGASLFLLAETKEDCERNLSLAETQNYLQAYSL